MELKLSNGLQALHLAKFFYFKNNILKNLDIYHINVLLEPDSTAIDAAILSDRKFICNCDTAYVICPPLRTPWGEWGGGHAYVIPSVFMR